MEKAENGKYICQFNPECECDIPACHKCGLNPEVAERRLKDYQRRTARDKKYKVPFTGYCEVWANSEEEAAELANDPQEHFFADYDFGDPIELKKEEEDE